MNSSFSRPRLRWLLAALAAAAFAAPVAQAHHAPGEDPVATTARQPFAGATSQSSTRTQWNASSREIDRLGPKNVALQHSVLPGPVNVVKVVRPEGFAWGDAAVGAAVFGLLLALVSGLAMLGIRRRRLRRRSLAIASLAS